LRLLRAWVLAWAERFGEAEAECRALLAEKLPPDDERATRLRLSEVYSTARQCIRSPVWKSAPAVDK